MLLKYPIDKPIIILIDVTSALYKNLRLDEEIKQWIAQKNISIICHESYQKFGLAHTDQVQAGAVYGLCHNESFTPAIINQFDENSRYDFENNLDMIVAQFIHQHCGDYLERIKENHFKNGSLFKHFFESKSIYSDPENNINHIHQYDEMLTNLNELYFFVTKPGTIDTSEEYQLNFAPHGCLATRDSFGHFSSCQLFIRSSKSYSNFSRVSPNASDPFDTIIDMIAICLFSKFDKTNELFDLLNSILLSRKSIQESFSREEEIFLAGLLVGLTRYYLKFDICSQVPLLLRGINHLIYNASDYLIGRNAYYLLKDTLSNKQTLFKADQIAVFVDETIQIEQERSIVLS